MATVKFTAMKDGEAIRAGERVPLTDPQTARQRREA